MTVLGRGGTGGSGTTTTAGFQYGVYVSNGGVIRGGTAGLTRVVGTDGMSSGGDATGVKVGGNTAGTITSLGGNLEVVGQAGGIGIVSSLNVSRGVEVEGSGTGLATISAGGTGTLTVRGTGSALNYRATGIRLFSQNSSIVSNGGRLEIIGTGGSSTASEAVGVLVQGGTITAGNGADLLLQGTGGANGEYFARGIVIENGSAANGTGSPAINVNGGHAQILGQAGNSTTGSTGIIIAGGSVSVGATGSLRIDANVATAAGSGYAGGLSFEARLVSLGADVSMVGGLLYFSPFYSSQMDGSSNLRLEALYETGVANPAMGINYGNLQHTGNGTLTIIADTMSDATSTNIDFGSGRISIDTHTPGVPITLGFGSSGLSLTQSWLASFRATMISIGSATSGKLTVNENISRSQPTQLNLASGGAIEFNNAYQISTGGGGLKLSPGAAGVMPGTSTSDIGVGTAAPNNLTFAANTNLNMVLSFGSSKLLGVSGNIDLTGANLVISGAQTLAPSDSLVIVDNDGTDPIVGTFNGLPEGSIVNANGVLRRLTYLGGTGNDVELAANRLPTIATIPNQTMLEDTTPLTINLNGITSADANQAVQVTSSILFGFGFPAPTVDYTSPNTTATLTFVAPPNRWGNVLVRVTVRDAGFDGVFNTDDDGVTNTSFNVDVTGINDPPTFTVGPNQAVAYNAPVQTVANWVTNIYPEPNEFGQTVTFNVLGNTSPELFAVPLAVSSNGTLTYTPAVGAIGTATITLNASDNGGTANGGINTSPSQTFTITIGGPATFQVTTFVPTATGGILNFSRPLDLTTLNLYDIQGNPFGPPDVVFTGATVGAIRGSAVVDPNLRRITFVATSGRLPPDAYTVTVRSAANGVLDAAAELLDGDADGTAGGDFVGSFNVVADEDGTVALRLPNFARGPQQTVNLPASGTSGIPISFSDGGGITSANFQIRYNPALLSITAASVAPGLPAGATVNLDTSVAGVATLQFTSPTPLDAGVTRFVDLTTSVPSTAPYRSKHVLDLTNVVLNAGAVPGSDDDAVHVVAYFGDVTANGTYSAQDASLLARLSVGIDGGLENYKLLDPTILGDLTGNGGFSATDTAMMLHTAVGIPVAEIPTPLPTVSLIAGGPDPKLSIPRNLQAAPGESLEIPVDIDSIVNLTGHGLASADLVLYFDPRVIDVASVSLGRLLAQPDGAPRGGWMISSHIDRLAGRIDIALAGTTPLEGQFVGQLLRLQATVKPDAPAGTSAINLAASSRSRVTQLNEGFLTLIPAPTDAANDPIDGLLTVTRPLNSPAAPDSAGARLVGNQLLVTGTAADDRILISQHGDTVRIRAGHRILGNFAAPAGIAIDSRTGDDFVYVAPTLPATVIQRTAETNDRDLIFAADNTALVSLPTPLNSPSAGSQSSNSEDSREAALLELLALWSEDRPAEMLGQQRNSAVRRR